jgi:DNA segregation ATPase FtsK/SpoIIIE, S-DNA-T family
MAASGKGSRSSSRSPRSRSTAGRSRAAKASPNSPRTARPPLLVPGTLRSIIGVALIIVGALIVVALLLGDQGLLGRFVTETLRPTFGQGAWLLGVLLVVGGVTVERNATVHSSRLAMSLGGILVFLAGEGLIQLVATLRDAKVVSDTGGGTIGQWLSSTLTALVGNVGAFLVLAGLVVVGLLLMFGLTLRALLQPVSSGGKAVASATSGAVAATVNAARARAASDKDGQVATPAPPAATATRGAAKAAPPDPRPAPPAPAMPVPTPSPVPLSQTVWAGGAPDIGAKAPVRPPSVGTLPADTRTGTVGSDGSMAALGPEAAPSPRPPRTWSMPRVDILDLGAAPSSGGNVDHIANTRIIEEKLRSFQIPAQVVGVNSGPVVTQYEVKPDVRVKLSRIEGLSDDLAMALAARSIRIEAPIPGKDVVGIEIPNHASEVVGFRRLYEDARMEHATSKLTFALGRDVSGKAYAVDLARMPHLLIAGATGSGKSVCVNALITSLLMRATPGEVELILVDLKRVELSAYADLPHLKAPVIMEPNQARAALTWAVGQMEDRYKLLAAKGERNLTAYNASVRVEEDERLPYLVLVIDELADLMMREGRKVEDPIVKLAQKARAVGIHLVLATQRPSVNVVTGLIKANVPSRIAFAMASNVDSRTVLDQPGAEDLIGRGDMLYQPSDLPRPVRLQGVFLSDAEVHAVCEHWRVQDPNPVYDPEVLAGSAEDAEDGGGEFGWLSKMAEDELTPRAAELVMLTGKASTSMMQTKLKVGFNRASRLMEELERVGIVGPQDPRNPATPRQVYGPENWLRSTDAVDEP